MLMIQDRNLTSHTYNRATADAIAANIQMHYLGYFQSMRTRLQIRLEQFECSWMVRAARRGKP